MIPYNNPLVNSTGGTDLLNPGLGSQPLNIMPQNAAAQPGQPDTLSAILKLITHAFGSQMPGGQGDVMSGIFGSGGGGAPQSGVMGMPQPQASTVASLMKKPGGGLY